MNIEYIGNNAIVQAEQTAFTYEVSESPRDFYSFRTTDETLDWRDKDYHIGNWRIHPYGDNNDLPKEIKKIIQSNSDAPGILKKKTQLLWGKGPKLYREEINPEGELVKKWTDDKQITKWLESWDYEEYLTRCAVDFSYMEGAFTKFFSNKGRRIGKPKIAKLEHINMDKTRLASRFNLELVKPTHAVYTDFEFNTINSLIDMNVYPLFKFTNPFKHKVSVFYSNMYSFCMDYYTVPDIYGSLEWLRRSNAIPVILKALSKNSINLKYHVISPQAFWDMIEEKLKEKATREKKDYRDSMLKEYETKLLRQVSDVLSGEANTGKFWHTKKILEVDGTNLLEHGWEIKPIDQKIKDFVNAQVAISNHASQKVNTSVGLHSALGNSGDKGKVDSGGEQYYALSNYLATGIDIPEMIVLKPINYALKINFPEKELKLGFYHEGTKRLEEITPKDRP